MYNVCTLHGDESVMTVTRRTRRGTRSPAAGTRGEGVAAILGVPGSGRGFPVFLRSAGTCRFSSSSAEAEAAMRDRRARTPRARRTRARTTRRLGGAGA